jgi:hypothetical protein
MRKQGPSRLWTLIVRSAEGRMAVDPFPNVPDVFFGVQTFVRTTLQLARATSPTLLSVFSDNSTLTRESMGAPCERASRSHGGHRRSSPVAEPGGAVTGQRGRLARAVPGERGGNLVSTRAGGGDAA